MKTNIKQCEKELKSLFMTTLRKIKKDFPKGKWKYWKKEHLYVKNDKYRWWKPWESEYIHRMSDEPVTYISKKEYDDNYELGKANSIKERNNELKESYYTYGKCRESNAGSWDIKMYNMLHHLESTLEDIDIKDNK